jgi:hypothetical protein
MMQGGIGSGKSDENDEHTKALDPKKAPSPLPLFEHVTSRKPCGSATVTRFASDIVICPWIWCRQPMSRLLLHPVTCKLQFIPPK